MIQKWTQTNVTVIPGLSVPYQAKVGGNIFQIVNRAASGGGTIYADDNTNANVSSTFYALKVDQGNTGAIVRPYAPNTIYLTTDAGGPVQITVIEIYSEDVSFVFNASQVLQIQGGIAIASDNVGLAKNATLTNGSQLVQLRSSAGLEPSVGGAGADNVNNNAMYVAGLGYTYNGSAWDRFRGNVASILLGPAARTASTASANQTNYNAKGVMVFLNVTAASGTGGLILRFTAFDPQSGGFLLMNVAPTAVTATGLYVYTYYPGITAGGTQATSGALPRTWGVTVTHSDASSYTYSVAASLIM